MTTLRLLRRSTFSLLLLVLLPVAAFAHAKPKVMNPAPDSSVQSPAELSLTFTEAVDPRFSKLELTDAKGIVLSHASTVADTRDHAHLSLPLPHLAAGTYFVHWVTAAIDGHRMEGSYPFKVL